MEDGPIFCDLLRISELLKSLHSVISILLVFYRIMSMLIVFSLKYVCINSINIYRGERDNLTLLPFGAYWN